MRVRRRKLCGRESQNVARAENSRPRVIVADLNDEHGKDAVALKVQAENLETPTANVAGTWKLTVLFKPGQPFEHTLKLVQTGSSLSGTYHGEQGETPIAGGLIFGDELTFEVIRERSGNKYRLRYQGKVSGEMMKGSVEYDFDGIGGFLDFEGKRIKP